jgi:hypothetical protein
MWNTRVVEIIGNDSKVTELLLEDTINHDRTKKPTDGVFVAIGHQPAVSVFADQLKIDKDESKKVCRGSLDSLLLIVRAVPIAFSRLHLIFSSIVDEIFSSLSLLPRDDPNSKLYASLRQAPKIPDMVEMMPTTSPGKSRL